MSNSKRGFYQISVLTMCASLLIAAVLAHLLDLKHPATPCAPWEKDYWNGEGSTFFRFARTSVFFWSSLCGDDAPPLLISASEGLVEPAFISYFPETREFTGPHRGIKTFGYMASHTIHPDRLKHLRAIVFINPVYFSFAAATDAASIRLNAISTLNYLLNVGAWKQKWDAFFLDWFYVGLRSYYSDWLLLRDPPLVARPEAPPPQSKPHYVEFDFKRNMYIERANWFTSYTARFSSREEPTHTLFEKSVAFARAHPEVPLCFVLLPINTRNLRWHYREADQIVADMNQLFNEVPKDKALNLMDMNENTYIFWDPMHFDPYGVSEIAHRVRESECGKRVLGAGR